MVLVCEGLRNPAVERNLIHDTNTYTANWGVSKVWTDLKSWTFTLASDSYLHLRFKVQYYHTSGSSSTVVYYYARIKEGTSPAIPLAFAFRGYNVGASYNVSGEGHGLVRLASGSHTVTLQGCAYSTSDAPTVSYVRVTTVSIGTVSLSDASMSYDIETAGVSCTAGSYTTVVSANVTAPTSNRNTVLGALKSDKYTVFVFTILTPTYTTRNSGDTSSGVYMYKDGAKVDWTERETSDNFDAVGGAYVYQATAGDSDTIEVKCNPAVTATVYGTLAIILCPWIVHASSGTFPVTLEAPVGATIKITLEPFNAFDYCFLTAQSYGFRLGGYKGVVNGLYDYSATGTGGTRVDATYTFTGMQSDDLTLVEVYGKMCIISYIALDTA